MLFKSSVVWRRCALLARGLCVVISMCVARSFAVMERKNAYASRRSAYGDVPWMQLTPPQRRRILRDEWFCMARRFCGGPRFTRPSPALCGTWFADKTEVRTKEDEEVKNLTLPALCGTWCAEEGEQLRREKKHWEDKMEALKNELEVERHERAAADKKVAALAAELAASQQQSSSPSSSCYGAVHAFNLTRKDLQVGSLELARKRSAFCVAKIDLRSLKSDLSDARDDALTLKAEEEEDGRNWQTELTQTTLDDHRREREAYAKAQDAKFDQAHVALLDKLERNRKPKC